MEDQKTAITEAKFNTLASDLVIQKTIAALKQNGIEAESLATAEQAKARALELIPQGSEVMTMTSVTLESIGVLPELNESGKYSSVRAKLTHMDRATQGLEMQKLGAAPEYVIGSVHAVTEDGKVLIASNTGSQLSAYAYGASHVIWIVGAQKIVSDEQGGLNRIWNYILPRESVRARKQYNLPDTWNSNPSKILSINRETVPGRIHLLFVNEILGF